MIRCCLWRLVRLFFSCVLGRHRGRAMGRGEGEKEREGARERASARLLESGGERETEETRKSEREHES